MPSEPAGAAAEPAAGAAVLQSAFKQPHFADEVSNWLTHRATPAEAERFDRYMQLIQQAAGVPLHAFSETQAAGSITSSMKSRPASSLGFTPAPAKKPQQLAAAAAALLSRPATASPTGSSNTWKYTATKKAAAGAASRMSSPGATAAAAAAGGLLGQGLWPFSAAAAAAAASTKTAATETAIAGSSASPAPSSTSSTVDASCSSPKCVNVTTAQAFHGLKELYPDLWAATTPICSPQPAPNKNFVSEWGDSLRQGASEAWAPYLASTYQVANEQVAKPTDEFAVRADEALLAWAAKQKLYFGDLLAPEAAKAAEALLAGQHPAAAAADTAAAGIAGLPLEAKKELVDLLRQLSAVVLPDSTQSLSHTLHKPQHSVEHPATTVLMKEQTRIKTMGFPRKVAVKGFAHTATKTAAAAAAASSASIAAAADVGTAATAAAAAAAPGALAGVEAKRQQKAVKASEIIDTLSSKVPLKWAASSVVPVGSSYTAAFGAHPGRSPQMFKTVFKEVNVGFGHVDQHQYPTGSGAYPVEQLYLERPLVPGDETKEADLKTTQRMSYKPRDPESVASSVAAACEQIEASRAARNKSFIPLSKAGIQLGSSAQWCSSYGADFIPRKADLSANKAMAHAVSAMFTGPTIAYGKIAGIRPEDAAGIAKCKAQQEASAAATAQQEAELDKRAAATAARK